MGDTFRLAHLTDAHLALHGRLRLPELLGKRGLSALNWRLRRSDIHRAEVAEALREDMLAHDPDHIAFTGDLVNFGLQREFENGAEWLRDLGPVERVSYVPGNHEAIMPGAEGAMNAAFAPWTGGRWPWVKRVGEVALIGVSTSTPSPPSYATGRVGAAQLDGLSEALAETRSAFRVILIHHPPAGPVKHRKRLLDAAAFAAVVEAKGAELILHGHNHRTQQARIGDTPVVGAPSFSARPGGHDDPAEWRLIEIEDGAARIHRRQFTESGVIDAGEVRLS
ncbi:MAG: metallophosphoesterase [Pseudomonadota bacterium]